MMNFGNLLFQQPYNIRKQVRNIETNEKKLIQAKMTVVLNDIYIYISLNTTAILACISFFSYVSIFFTCFLIL